MEAPKKKPVKAPGKPPDRSPNKRPRKPPGKMPDTTAGRTPVDTTELWDKSKDIFLEEFKSGDYPSKKYELSLQRMIADVKTFPERPAGNELKRVSRGGRVVWTMNSQPVSHINNSGILQKLELVLEFGDKAMVAAPELVSLAWMGIRVIANVSP
ncbi:hypothetical protein GTA08_BOTSDO03203 [Botryosphaeria dothidea]|uniref:Uncharacterized protein n=1 Tax=Botryosphaeria dothidea TaxID=55169 RepID=A0A8H4IZS7_9PEZI|nr:hypothetical protein GTA08_BOTSDO03203 [Botryosphaeria dothidea]